MVELWVNKKANIALSSETKEVEELEFELTDILEDVNAQDIKQIIRNNIVYLLRREHKRGNVKYPSGYSVIIPEGAYTIRAETKGESGAFEGDFEIFAKDMNTIVRYGHVYGTISAEQLLDITVWLKRETERFFRVTVAKFTTILVKVDLEEKRAIAKDESLSFDGSAVIGHDKEIVAITNDITTNYLDVAMAKAFQRCGLKVKDKRPYPLNRKFSIREIQRFE